MTASWWVVPVELTVGRGVPRIYNRCADGAGPIRLSLIIFLSLLSLLAGCTPRPPSETSAPTGSSSSNPPAQRKSPFYWGTNAVLYDIQDVNRIESLGGKGKVCARVTFYWSDIEPADLRFDSVTPVSAGTARYWQSLVAYLGRQLITPDRQAPLRRSALLQSSALDMLAAAALTVFPNTAMTAAQLPGPGYVAPAAVRRAVAFIDEHADRDISATDIAAAAHVTVRAVQLAFRRHLDTTPSAYLRRVRLDRAHQQLCAANPGDGVTVTEIATRWGFASPSRFAASYNAAYGVLPSRTLRS